MKGYIKSITLDIETIMNNTEINNNNKEKKGKDNDSKIHKLQIIRINKEHEDESKQK